MAGKKKHVSRLNHPGESGEKDRIKNKGCSHVRLEWKYYRINNHGTYGDDFGRFLAIGNRGDGNAPVGSRAPEMRRKEVVSPCFEGVILNSFVD